MVLRKDEEFDRTDLNIQRANERGMIHRDYIAHCFRWTYIQNWLSRRDSEFAGEKSRKNHRYQHAHVLDIGCGKDLMLYRVLNSNKLLPLSYTGVDINELAIPTGFEGSRLKPNLIQQDFCSIASLPTAPNLITCFEMLEHVPIDYARRTLNKAYELSSDGSYLILSTPVYYERYGMANNHINEMTRPLLVDMLMDCKWKIKENYGTFCGQYEIRNALTEEEKKIYDELRNYYSTHVLSTIFAPMYPEYSRNNLWVCTK